jgi:hypothetical protein
MDLRIEIADEHVTCYQDGRKAFVASIPDFLASLARWSDHSALPEPILDGVRVVRDRGDVKVLVLEEQPQVRAVRWLADESPVPFGRGAVYRTVSLAFPFIVSIVAFRAGALTGYQQCFYRTEPLGALSDPLCLPNLFNVADAYGQTCWLCLANLPIDFASLTWSGKVNAIRRYLWGAGFNRSSEMHEGMSYWGAMKAIDPRVASLEAWEQASRNDPLFPLCVQWKTSGRTLGEVIDTMLGRVAPTSLRTAADLSHVLGLAAGARPARLSSARR